MIITAQTNMASICKIFLLRFFIMVHKSILRDSFFLAEYQPHFLNNRSLIGLLKQKSSLFVTCSLENQFQYILLPSILL